MEYPYVFGKDKTLVIKAYLSTSRIQTTGFANKFKNADCCFYKIAIVQGMPFVDMRIVSDFPNETEIMLPRNIVLRHTGTETVRIIGIDNPVQQHNLVATPLLPNQFNSGDTGCKAMDVAQLIPVES